MALKPVDKRNGLDSRQAVWEAIRAKEVFNLKDVREETTMKVESVREYVIGLEKAGYVERVPQKELRIGIAACWRLIKDVGVEAPRVQKDGTPVTQGAGRKNMWEAMRIMRTFTSRELAVAASLPDCLVKESTAEDYAKHLCKAGYLRKNGSSYMFLPTAYTGPMAPQIQRTKRVWDPNQHQVRWSSTGEGSDDK